MKTVILFVPHSLSINSVCRGKINKSENCYSFYVFDNHTKSDIIGYVGKNIPKRVKIKKDWINFIINDENRIVFQSIKIDNNHINLIDCDFELITILYDYNYFYEANMIKELLNNSIKEDSNHFSTLHELKYESRNVPQIYNKQLIATDNYSNQYVLKTVTFFHKSIKHSAVVNHIIYWLNSFHLLLSSIKNKKTKLSLKETNLLFTFIFDVLGGFWLSYYLPSILHIILNGTLIENQLTIEKEFIDSLKDSPIGIKLNHALSTLLISLFVIIIDIWQYFLDIIIPIIIQFSCYLYWLRPLGVNFFIAIISDLFILRTLHIYFIYYCCTFLFKLQTKTLKSLLRLFIGRKFNPLRHRVDSCQYNDQQLFLGMLIFTILLFLLLTTGLYYFIAVSIIFCVLFTHSIFHRINCIFQYLPLYALFLWCINSPRVSNRIHLNVVRPPENSKDPLLLNLTLKTKPLTDIISMCIPKYESLLEVIKSRILKIMTGKLINYEISSA